MMRSFRSFLSLSEGGVLWLSVVCDRSTIIQLISTHINSWFSLASEWSNMDPKRSHTWSRVEVIHLSCDVLFPYVSSPSDATKELSLAFPLLLPRPAQVCSLKVCILFLSFSYILTSTIINLFLGFCSVPSIHEHLHCQVLSCRKDSPRKWCKWSCVGLCASV